MISFIARTGTVSGLSFITRGVECYEKSEESFSEATTHEADKEETAKLRPSELTRGGKRKCCMGNSRGYYVDIWPFNHLIGYDESCESPSKENACTAQNDSNN